MVSSLDQDLKFEPQGISENANQGLIPKFGEKLKNQNCSTVVDLIKKNLKGYAHSLWDRFRKSLKTN